MSAIAFDTLKFAQTLREKAKFSQEQSEGIAIAFAEASKEQLVSKPELKDVKLALQEANTAVEKKIEKADSSTDKKIDALHKKVDDIEVKFDKKFDTIEHKIDKAEVTNNWRFKLLQWMMGILIVFTMANFWLLMRIISSLKI